MTDRLGQQFGNYQLIALLGQGSYAEVYLGRHVRLDLQAAIKVLHGHLSSSEAERFQHEAQTMERLTHPSIVRVFDFAVQDGIPFLVMEYAPGGSLRRRYLEGSIVSLPEILPPVKQVATALQYAHEQKYIHRDVKPENMLLGRQQVVLLSDFGLAALARSTASLSTQGTVGTIAYIAPEQIEGHPRAASDQYALAVVVYEWLCGVRPFEGSATEVVVKQLGAPPPPLREHVPTISAEVEQVVLRALAKDPKERFASVAAFATALERASQLASSPLSLMRGEQPRPGSGAAFATHTAPTSEPVVSNETAAEPALAAETPRTPGDGAVKLAPVSTPSAFPLAVTPPGQAGSRLLLEAAPPARRKGLARFPAALLIGLGVLVVVGGLLGSVSLLAHFGIPSAHSGTITAVMHGGTWTDDIFQAPDSLLPNGSGTPFAPMIDNALYLPLFYGDAQGVIRPGAATEVPTVQNGGVSADATTWTFHLRPHLLWSDGQPYDARDVDYTWQLWRIPAFGASNSCGLNMIASAGVSVDRLSITFHLKQPFAPFLSCWVDGFMAPLPAHHFRALAPEAIKKSPDNLNPTVTSGPFLLTESVPGDHYTLVRNSHYYRASEGLPYLDKVVFRIVDIVEQDAILQDLQAGTITSAWFLDPSKAQDYQRLTHYSLVTPLTSAAFEGMYFNFHNVVLASHPEVRQAMAMAIDQQALIQQAYHGLATPLCTDHGSFYHPGYETNAPCPEFNPTAANKLLADKGWVMGPDGVRAQGDQRLEFEYSSTANNPWRSATEAILQRDFQAIGIKLDIQNPPAETFFGTFLPGGEASPPTGAVAGRYDIAEFQTNWYYDPDDSSLLSCDQIPPNGYNVTFYCNPTLDALYKQEVATADPGLRQQLFSQIHQIYLTAFPFITLYGSPNIAMVRKGTHNYQMSDVEGGTVNIWEWWCDGGKC